MIELLIAIVNQVAPVLGAIAACGAVYVSWRNGQKVERTERKIDVAHQQIEEVKVEAKVRREDIDMLKTGAFRAGHVAGQEYQKAQSDFGKLSGK